MKEDPELNLEMLSGLPPVVPEIEWEARVRARCHAALLKQNTRNRRGARAFETAAVAALSLYLAVVLLDAVQLWRML